MELGGETQEAFSNHDGETQESLSEHEKKPEVLADCEQEQQRKVNEEGHGPIPPALRKLIISGNIPPILASRTRS